MKILFSCALFLSALMWCGAQTPPVTSHAESAAYAMGDYALALQHGTPAQIAAFYAPNGQLLLPGTPKLKGPKAIEAFLVPLVKQAKVTGVGLSIEPVIATGSPQVLFGAYQETFVVGTDKPQLVTGRFAAVWRKDGAGPWKIYRLMMQPAPLVTPETGTKS